MSWFKRLKEDHNVYHPREAPDYSDPDNFTIKLHYGGELKSDHTAYVGGSVDYFDFCNVDEFSWLDLGLMMKECECYGGFHSYMYKLPGTDMDKGLFELDNDADVMDMCFLVKGRFAEVFATIIEPLSVSQPEFNTQNVDYVEGNAQYNFSQAEPSYENFDFMDSTQAEMDQENEFRDAFGIHSSTDSDSSSDSSYVVEAESSEESFYSDNSNKDASDVDLEMNRNADELGGNKAKFDEELGDELSDHSSTYADSEEERMVGNSTDEDEIGYPVYHETSDGKPVFELGMCFKDAKTFRAAVKKHAILERRPISNVRNFGIKVKYVCESPCKWKIYASPMQKTSTYQIKTFFGEHSCMPTFNQKQINSKWLAEFYEKEIRMNPSWPIKSFHKKIVNDLKCNVSKHVVYRAKTRALVKINGTHAEQYSQIWKYAYELRRVLPESTVKILTEDPEPGVERGRFMRLYVCLGPIKKAFSQHCRKLVGLDGCHLKGPFGGQLLAAVGVDANEGMYPIAWSVVEAENTESWTWFLELLCKDIRILVDREWTFISDRQKGLINALEAIVPHAEHRFCVMHLFQNMHKEHKGIALRSLLWKAARASTKWEFNLHMNQMKEISPKCFEWLSQKPTEQWTRSSFRTTCSSDMFVNNHCEVFNASIRQFRDLPILTMFRQIHIAVMKRIQNRRDKMKDRELVICPSAQKKLNKAVQLAGNCVVIWSGDSTYSVTCSNGGHELVVDLEKKNCTCRKWDLTGIPCYHACACIAFRNDPWEIYISDWYKKDMYMQLYSYTLKPIVGPEFWEEANEPMSLPPNVKTPTGRPKKKRNKQNDIPADPTKLKRQNTIVHCTYCKAGGHNWRTCEARKTDEVKKAQAEGRQVEVGKTKVTCKNCSKEGHNSRTCKVVKAAPNTSSAPTMMVPEQGQRNILQTEQENANASTSAPRKHTKATARKKVIPGQSGFNPPRKN